MNSASIIKLKIQRTLVKTGVVIVSNAVVGNMEPTVILKGITTDHQQMMEIPTEQIQMGLTSKNTIMT